MIYSHPFWVTSSNGSTAAFDSPSFYWLYPESPALLGLMGIATDLFGAPHGARLKPALISTALFSRDFFGNALGTLPRPIRATRYISPSTSAMLSPVVDWYFTRVRFATGSQHITTLRSFGLSFHFVPSF
jgi:hypothetical protein